MIDEIRELIRLYETENDSKAMTAVRESGCTQFAQHVRSCGVKPARYEAFKAGYSRIVAGLPDKAPTVALAIGMDAVLVAGQVEADMAVPFITSCCNWVLGHDGQRRPSRATCKQLLRRTALRSLD